MRNAKVLTVKQIAAISSGLVCVGGVKGLYVQVRNQTKNWVFRYSSPVTGKRNFVSIGSYPTVSLADARKKAYELAREVENGKDIAEERKKQRQELRAKAKAEKVASRRDFATIAEKWLVSRVASGYYDKNVRGESVVRGYLLRNINPYLGEKDIQAIQAKDIFDCLSPIWLTTTEAKHKCLTIISGVFRWAQAMGLHEGQNPADSRGALGVLLANLSPHAVKPRNWGAISPEKMPDFFADILSMGTMASKALAFAILTASRSKPVREAKWEEIDLKTKTWKCPENSMKVKGRGVFVVVLSDQAVRLLKSLPRSNEYVFPSPYRGKAISDAGIGQVIADINKRRVANSLPEWVDDAQSEAYGKVIKATVHGTCRATFKTWTRLDNNLNRFDRDAVELCLAHKVDDGFGGAYDRATLIEERRRIMTAWGEFCVSSIKE